MRKFIQRALDKIGKLDSQQIQKLILDLSRDNERLEMAMGSMTDGVVVVDSENRLVYYNKAAERLLPLEHAELHEKPIWSVVEDGDIAAFIRENLEKQETVLEREFNLLSGGTTRTIACTILPLVSSGRIQGSLFHIEEVTEKRGKEARLRRAESLAALTNLAAGVAHEIKNPLGSIGIHIQLMQKAIRDRETVDWDSIEHFLFVVNEEVERLNKIVVDFLFAVRPMNIELIDQPLNPIVEELLEFVRYELEKAGIVLRLELAAELPDLNLDAKHVKQALLNIVKNAMHAMPAGGTLTIQTSRRGDEVTLSVADTGQGIPAEIINKIFEPYFTTRDFGSGLGLTIVYKIVKEHRGEIAVDSEPGRGARISLSFPVPQREQHLLGWRGEPEAVRAAGAEA